MISWSDFRPIVGSLGLLLATGLGLPAHAQQEFPPPQGKGRVVLMLSGIDRARPYEGEAKRVAKLGYDVILVDATTIPRDSAPDLLRTQIDKALKMPHALPGKVALVGYSLGGGRALQAAGMADQVALIVAWYPAVTAIVNQDQFASNLTVPILLFAGEDDKKTISDSSAVLCCSASLARALAAKAAGKQLELITYPGTAHGFIAGHPAYKASSYDDASKRMDAKLGQSLQ
jgi:dienelactone hydrolase